MEQLLNISTLFFVGSLGGLCVAAIMSVVWLGDRRRDYVGFWALSYYLFSISSLLMAMRGMIAIELSLQAAWTLFLLAHGVSWLGYREFAGRRGRHDLAWVSLGALAWLLFTFDPILFPHMYHRVVFQSAATAAYSLPSALELWRLYRREPLPVLPLFIGLYSLHGAIQFVRAIATPFLALPSPATTIVPYSPLTAFVMTESILIIVLVGMAQLALLGQRAERIYRIAAQTDALTGLCSRRHFLEIAVPTVATSHDTGALILLDLDHFKVINDTHGHAAGDAVLVAFAATVEAAVHAPNLFARIGGEEFAILMPDGDEAAALTLADRVRRAVAGLAIRYRNESLKLTVSCGVATVAGAGPHYDHLHRDADAALYEAKARGRNRVVVATATRRDRDPDDEGVALADPTPA